MLEGGKCVETRKMYSTKDILQVEIMRSHKLFEINYSKLKKIAVILLS